jgi:hypothetical protein
MKEALKSRVSSKNEVFCEISLTMRSLKALEPEFKTFKEPWNRFQGINSASLYILASGYDNPIHTWFLAPIDCLKIPAQGSRILE